MNDMTRQTSAARLSEDIGDVLSAIRRLIAEDEALTAAREQREHERSRAAEVEAEAQPAPVAVGGDVLASRYGGNAALARRMAQSVQASRKPQPVDEAPGETGEARAARRFDRLEPARISALIDDADMSALTIDSPDVAGEALHPFEAAFLRQTDDEVYELWLDDAAELVAEVEPEAAAVPAAEAEGPSAEAADVYELWLEPWDASAEATDAPAETPAPAPTPLRLREADRIIASAPASGHETPAELNRMLAWRPWTPAAPSAGLTLDIAALSAEDEEDFAAAFEARIAPATKAEAPLEPGHWHETAQEDAASAPVAQEPVTEAPLAALPPQPEVALEPISPMPESLMRPRTSRWARIEPPVTRERRRPAPMAMAPMTPATSQPGALSQRGAMPVSTEAPVAVFSVEPPAPVATMATVAPAPVQPTVVPNEPLAAIESPLPATPEPLVLGETATMTAPVAASVEVAPDAVALETAPAAVVARAETVDAPEAPAASGSPLDDAENEALVREVIREMIQEELHGELGQRFARNLRAVIRREVAAAIEDQFDRV